jgi:hypothetical protein
MKVDNSCERFYLTFAKRFDTLHTMSRTVKESPAKQPPLATGQVWELDDANLEIRLVGKTLVHYKHFVGKTKRAPVSLAGIKELTQFLKVHKAVLIEP